MNTHIPAILIVDDEAPVREYLRELLEPSCDRVSVAANLSEAIHCMDATPHDIVLADICMPGPSGLDLLQLSLGLKWDSAVVLMTGQARMEQLVLSVRFEAADFILKPFSSESLLNTISSAYNKLLIKRQKRSEREVLSSGLIERTQELAHARLSLRRSYRSTLETLVATLEAREYETYAHSFRVRAYALHLAHLIRYSRQDLPRLAFAALLHDIGKIAVSDSILLKPGPLTAEEFELLKNHSAVGERIVSRIGFLGDASKVVRHHHERWDGRGYPDHLTTTLIPLGSRLFAVADTLDAMTSDRCYRKALTLSDAKAEILRFAGSQFDPDIASLVQDVPDAVWRELRVQADEAAHKAIIPDDSIPGVPAELPQLIPAVASPKKVWEENVLRLEPSGNR